MKQKPCGEMRLTMGAGLHLLLVLCINRYSAVLIARCLSALLWVCFSCCSECTERVTVHLCPPE